MNRFSEEIVLTDNENKYKVVLRKYCKARIVTDSKTEIIGVVKFIGDGRITFEGDIKIPYSDIMLIEVIEGYDL